MIYSVDVRVTAPVNDTEVEDRVVRAIEAVFPGVDVETEGNRVVAETHSVERFAEQLREQRILDTARTVLRNGRRGDRVEFDLKKQAAFVGVVNFSVGNPDELGDIHVEMTVRDPSVDAFVAALAPETDDEGRPVEDPLFEGAEPE